MMDSPGAIVSTEQIGFRTSNAAPFRFHSAIVVSSLPCRVLDVGRNHTSIDQHVPVCQSPVSRAEEMHSLSMTSCTR